MKDTIKQKAAELLNKFNQVVDSASEVSSQVEDKLKTVFHEVKSQITDILDRDEKDINQIKEGEYVISPVDITIRGIVNKCHEYEIKAGQIFPFKSFMAPYIHTRLIVPTPEQLIQYGRINQMESAINHIRLSAVTAIDQHPDAIHYNEMNKVLKLMNEILMDLKNERNSP